MRTHGVRARACTITVFTSAVELARWGIRVNAVRPGIIEDRCLKTGSGGEATSRHFTCSGGLGAAVVGDAVVGSEGQSASGHTV